jgi:hypothetical protein
LNAIVDVTPSSLVEYSLKMTTGDTIDCRLCGQPARLKFHKTVRERLRVGYFECTECGSLQTERPYWLDDAYSDSRRPFDVFAASRAVILQAKLYLFSRLAKLPVDAKWIDWGAGDGLLVRLLRDVGIDAYHYEPMGRNVYAFGFEADLATKFDVVTAVEVWEHLPDPADELGRIFALQPEYHIATTGIYTGQDETWNYLYAQTGRHVFFYSPRAVEYVAEKFGYQSFVVANKLLVFHRPKLSSWRRVLLQRIFGVRSLRLLRTVFSVLRKSSLMMPDQQMLLGRFERGELQVEGKRGDPSTVA